MKFNKKILFILTAGLVLTSCKSNTETGTVTDSDTTTIIFEKQTEPIIIDNETNTEQSDDLTREASELEPVHIESKSTQKRVDMRNNTHSFSVNSFYLIVF